MINILGPIILITLIGYVLGRSSVGLHSRTISDMVLLVATPSLVFHTLVSMHVGPETIATMSVAALMSILVAGTIAVSALLLFKGSIRSFLPALTLPNSGNMGLPLVVLTFGQDSLSLAIAYFFVVALFQYSVGLSITAGSLRMRELARQPLVYSVLLALLVSLLNLPMPQVVMKTTEMLGGMMIPAMLILLGSSLATLTVSDLKPAVAVAIGRLLIGIVTALIVIVLLGLEGVVAGAVFLLATMSAAIVNYVFAERYNQNANQVAGAVVVSTLLTFICLPALVWMSIRIANFGVPGFQVAARGALQ